MSIIPKLTPVLAAHTKEIKSTHREMIDLISSTHPDGGVTVSVYDTCYACVDQLIDQTRDAIGGDTFQLSVAMHMRDRMLFINKDTDHDNVVGDIALSAFNFRLTIDIIVTQLLKTVVTPVDENIDDWWYVEKP